MKGRWTRLPLVVGGIMAMTGACPAATPVPDFTSLPAEPPSAASAPRSVEAEASMIEIPAGRYTIGRDDGPGSEAPAHAVELERFRIDRTEVTNAAFAEFLNALDIPLAGEAAAGRVGEANLPAGHGHLLLEGLERSDLYPLIALDDDQARIGAQDGRFSAALGYEDHPVAETTWAGARAYCRWRGARLPSEAEWEAAARGRDGGPYPWGDAAPDAGRAFVSGRSGVTAAVGGRPAGASPFGVHDMAGSLAEWTSSLDRPYPYDPDDGREDPADPGQRITRGGDYVFDTAPEKLTTTHRDGFSRRPSRGHRHIGFRCAADA